MPGFQTTETDQLGDLTNRQQRFDVDLEIHPSTVGTAQSQLAGTGIYLALREVRPAVWSSIDYCQFSLPPLQAGQP